MTTPPPTRRPPFRYRFVLAIAACVAVTATPALGQDANPARSGGWTTTVYPIYGWLPVFGADIRLPEVPDPPPCDGCGDGGPIVPGGSVSSNFDGAAFAGVLVEHRWMQAEANFLWAGMSAGIDRPNLQVKVGTLLGAARVGVRVVPDLFVYGGVRRLALDIKARALVFDEVRWKPGIWESVIGAAYTPFLSRRWRLLLHADYGGLGVDDHSTYAANGTIEWHPMQHFAVSGGYGLLKITVDGAVLQKPIHLEQTLHGPIVGFGIPF